MVTVCEIVTAAPRFVTSCTGAVSVAFQSRFGKMQVPFLLGRSMLTILNLSFSTLKPALSLTVTASDCLSPRQLGGFSHIE